MAATYKFPKFLPLKKWNNGFSFIKNGSECYDIAFAQCGNMNLCRSFFASQECYASSRKSLCYVTKPTFRRLLIRNASRSAFGYGHRTLPAEFPCINGLACRGINTEVSPLKKTPLYDFHVAHGGKMVPFAGYEMPVQYGSHGIAESHMHTRNSASVFDVSHMLQSKIHGKDRIAFVETLVVADVQGLKEDHGTLTLYTNDEGGIIDDLIVTNTSNGYLFVVSNAGCIDKDISHVQAKLLEFQKKGGDAELEILTDRALLAMQGPKAAVSLQTLVDSDLSKLVFMTTMIGKVCGVEDCRITRCGYTGEDGFEISVPAKNASAIAEALLECSDVKLAGLGTRDTLRLEAGLCLYGNDMDEDTSPVEAGLVWTIGKRRKEKADFPGARIIMQQIQSKPHKRRVGFLSTGPPARAHTPILDEAGGKVGEVTSGGPSPCLKRNIAMGYVKTDVAKVGSKVLFEVRKKRTQAEVTKMPFVPTHYYTGK